jgi:hypothetical protein
MTDADFAQFNDDAFEPRQEVERVFFGMGDEYVRRLNCLVQTEITGAKQ